MSDASEPVEETFLGDLSGNGQSSSDGLFESVEYDIPSDNTTGFEDATTPIGDGTCDVCGAPTFRPPGLTPTGRRKRVPKRCDLHATNIRIPTEGPDARRLESQLQRMEEELADDLRLVAVAIGPFWPVTAYYMYDNADRFWIATLKLMKNNARALRVAHRFAQIAPVYQVLEFGGGIAVSVQVDNKKHDPHSVVAQRLGVAKAYDKVYPESASNLTNNGYTAPPRYATVQ